MKELLFLGTGAADWDMASADSRGFAGLLIDGHILIDCGPGAFFWADAQHRSGLFSEVDAVFFTHSHDDHFQTSCVQRLMKESRKPVSFYGDPVFERLLPNEAKKSFFPLDIRCHAHPSVIISDYTVTAAEANHLTEFPEEYAHHYLFEGADGKNFFIGYDGAWLLADTWNLLLKKHLDLYLADATCGDSEVCRTNFRNFSHNNIYMLDLMYATLCANGVIDASTKFVLTHVAKTLYLSREALEDAAARRGFLAAYDGLTLSL